MRNQAPRRIDFTGTARRIQEAISAGDARATDRAIRCAKNRGDWEEAERLTAEFLRLRGLAQTGVRDRAAALATLPLGERITGSQEG